MSQPSHLIPSDIRPAFAQSWRDWKYLEGQRELMDQVEEVDFFEVSLMRYPNKKTATCLLHQRIDEWFAEAGHEFNDNKSTTFDRRTRGIAERHLIDL